MAENDNIGPGSSTQKATTPKKTVSSKPQNEVNDSTGMSDSEKLGRKIDDSSKKVMDKLTNEGQLLRNTGTNSIKSIGDKLAKFNGAFNAISTEMAIQTSVLKNILNEAYIENDRMKNVEIERRIRDSEDRERRRYQPFPREPRPTQPKVEAKDSGGGVLGGLLTTLGPMLALAALPFRVIAALGGFIAADLASDAIERYIDDLNLDSLPLVGALVDPIMENLRSALTWGAIGRAFGKKMGLAGATAGVGFTLADQIVEKIGIADVDVMGMELGNVFGAILSGSMLYFTGQLNGLLGKKVAGEAVAAAAANGGAERVMRRGLLSRVSFMRLGIFGIIGTMVGSIASDALASISQSMGADEDLAKSIGDGVGTVANFALTGAMFGPTGALIGAGLGLVLVVGQKLLNFINNTRGVVEDKMQDATDILQKQLNDEDFTLSGNEVTDLVRRRDEAVESGDNNLVQALNAVLNTQQQRTGLDLKDVDGKRDIEDYVRENVDSLTSQFDAIQNNSNLSEAQKKEEAESLIKTIGEKFPEISAIDMAEILRDNVGDTSWWNSDGKNLLGDILQDPLSLGVNFSSGNTDVGTEYDTIMNRYQAENGEEFVANDPESLKWIENDPQAKEFFNKIYNVANDMNLEDQAVFHRTGNKTEDDNSIATKIMDVIRAIEDEVASSSTSSRTSSAPNVYRAGDTINHNTTNVVTDMRTFGPTHNPSHGFGFIN